MRFKRSKPNTPFVSGDDIITEFSDSPSGFSSHQGYVAQPVLPLRQSLFSGFRSGVGTGLKVLGERMATNTMGTYGYFRVFVKAELVKIHKKAAIAAYGMAKLCAELANQSPDCIVCHATKSEHSVNVEMWTLKLGRVINIHNIVNLSLNAGIFLQELKDALESYTTESSLPDHDVYLVGDEVLGIEKEVVYPKQLFERAYQLQESNLKSLTTPLELTRNLNGSTGSIARPAVTALALLMLGPIALTATNQIYKKRFESEVEAYRQLASTVDGLDEHGRNTAEVVLWEARDTYLRQQQTKSLDSDNLELLLKAISSAARTLKPKIIVRVIDYSRELKSRSGVPDYHFRIEMAIENQPHNSEGSTVDSVYRALGTALADVVDHFVSPKNPRTLQIEGHQYHGVEFVGTFRQIQMQGGKNAP